MKSHEYRTIIRIISRNVLRKHFPGLKRKEADIAISEIAIAIHARLYGASVDNVASPIWRDHPSYVEDFSDAKPTRTAQEILNEGIINGK